ncbi:MAG: membrane protein insertion efficiency factor YidD [Victivallaceae bacterium]
MTKIFIITIRAYQRLISPFLLHHCRFFPSCSEYAVQALSVKGLFKGTFLILKRILKCGPWSSGGLDVVPSMSLEESISFSNENRKKTDIES